MTPGVALPWAVPASVVAQVLPVVAADAGERPSMATGLPAFLALFMESIDLEVLPADGAMAPNKTAVIQDQLSEKPSTSQPLNPPVVERLPQVAADSALLCVLGLATTAVRATAKPGESVEVPEAERETADSRSEAAQPIAVPLPPMLVPAVELPPVVSVQPARIAAMPSSTQAGPARAPISAVQTAIPQFKAAAPPMLVSAPPLQATPIETAPAPTALPAPIATTPQAHPSTLAVVTTTQQTQAVDSPTTIETASIAPVPAAPVPPDIAPTPRAITTAPAWHAPLIQALGDRVHLQLSQRSEHAVIRLDPPSMGSVEIVLRHEAGVLQVQLSASHGDVQRQLLHIADALRQDLSQRQFSEVSVQVAAHPSSDGEARPRHAPPRGNERESMPGRAWADDDSTAASGTPFSLAHPAD